MASSVSSPSPSTSGRHVRSISLPSRSHPSTLQVEEELAYLKRNSSSLATVDTVCGSLAGLERLYISVNDLLTLPQIQQSLSHKKDEKLVKDHIRNTQSALRRKKEGLNFNSSSLKKINEAKKTLSALKQVDNKIGRLALLDLDHHLSSVIRSLRDTSSLSVSIFGSLLSLKSIFVSKPSSTKWSVVSNLIHKGKRASVDQPQMSNEGLESHIEIIENSLECMFRTLIKTRVSLLNISSL
ncbi:hypothetical protein Tco_0838969 [Tanacetum coccineum]|uniref:DUF241 domain-containing protein n=1 Tax=Tanacetum coccineum TaxID=301880 RepID=A0ABQ5AS56_9ASTR